MAAYHMSCERPTLRAAATYPRALIKFPLSVRGAGRRRNRRRHSARSQAGSKSFCVHVESCFTPVRTGFSGWRQSAPFDITMQIAAGVWTKRSFL